MNSHTCPKKELAIDAKRWRFLLVALVAALLTPMSVVAQSDKLSNDIPALGMSDFVLSKRNSAVQIELMEPVQKLINELGQPDHKQILRYGSRPEYDLIAITYGNLLVEYIRSGKEVLWIQVKGNDYWTGRLIKVGDNASAVIEAYGKPEYQGSTKDGHEVIVYSMTGEYESMALPLQITFTLKGTVVAEVILSIPPEN